MTAEYCTPATLLHQAINSLQNAGIVNVQQEAELLLSELLSLPRLELQLYPDRILDASMSQRLSAALERRARLEPLQYILGTAYFRELTLSVGPGVLIPRPETELLVDYVLRHAPAGAKVCDLGTGSGAIAISLAFERPDFRVTGIELSSDALQYAWRNAATYNLSNLKILQGDLFEPVSGEHFDFITANLPYVTTAEFAALDHEVGAYEPATALLGGDDGLDLVRRLIAALPEYLRPGGGVILELGIHQSEEVTRLLTGLGIFTRVETVHDYNRHPRFVAAG